MGSKISGAVVVAIIILIVIIPGCIEYTVTMKNIYIAANYKEQLDVDQLEPYLEQNNFTILDHDEGRKLTVAFGKGINNDSIEYSECVIQKSASQTSDNDGTSEIIVVLDPEKYPSVGDDENYRSKLESRKQLLEESLEFITATINDATGQRPVTIEFIYGDTAEVVW